MRKSALFVLAALAVTALGHLPTSASANSAETYRQLKVFGDAFDKVRTLYVEKPDETKLVEAAVNAMLASLDPHASYIDQKTFQETRKQDSGQFAAPGIDVTMQDGLLKVITPIDDGPAARAGLMANDIITEIDGERVQGLILSQAIERMRGEPKSSVRLKIKRGSKEPFEVTLTRDILGVSPVRARIEGGDVAYLRIGQFNEQTFEGLRQQIDKITGEIGADKIKGYVIDLRNNPGGLQEQAVMVADAFLERGEIVSIRSRNPGETERFEAKSGDLSNGKQLIVLINGGSASAAEIVAGALLDNRRASVMGTRSFGKGSVQKVIPLDGKGAIRMTVGRYFTPSGRPIHAKGIEPDQEVSQDVPDDLKGGSSAYIPSDPTKDKQLIAAVEYLKGGHKGAAAAPEAPKGDKPAIPN